MNKMANPGTLLYQLACLGLFLLNACTTQHVASVLSVARDTYTVIVYVKNEAPVYNFGKRPFIIDRRYKVEPGNDDPASPVIKCVYNDMTEEQYKELCRRLKDEPKILAVEKSP